MSVCTYCDKHLEGNSFEVITEYHCYHTKLLDKTCNLCQKPFKYLSMTKYDWKPPRRCRNCEDTARTRVCKQRVPESRFSG